LYGLPHGAVRREDEAADFIARAQKMMSRIAMSVPAAKP